jgi:hypothetical protein
MSFLSRIQVGTTVNKLIRVQFPWANGIYLIFSNDLSTGGQDSSDCVEYMGNFFKLRMR